jgi:hypothetical protein
MSFYEERDREVARIVGHDVGDFPLQRLSKKYGINFTERESELIQVMHKYIWMHYRDKVHELPVAFRGTPLELWTVIMFYSVSQLRFINVEIGRKMIPPSLYQEFMEINDWRAPLTPTVQSILGKICRQRLPIMMDSRSALNSFRRYQNDRTPQNIQDAIGELSAATDPYDSFPVQSRLEHVKFTDDEMAMIRINYTHILWVQFLNDDEYMAPASEEGTPMEIWLVSSFLMERYPLKTGLKSQNSWALGTLVYYKYYPRDIPRNAENLTSADHQHDIIIIVEPIKVMARLHYGIINKLSKTVHDQFHLHRERTWVMTSALTHTKRGDNKKKSPFMTLPLELNRHLRSYVWKDHYDQAPQRQKRSEKCDPLLLD